MPIYSSTSLKAYPWLWKYDSRRSSKCSRAGHRHRWFHHDFKSYHGFFGLCKKCAHMSFYRTVIDEHGSIAKVYKQFGKVIEVNKEEAEQMLAECVADVKGSVSEVKCGMDASTTHRKPAQNSGEQA